MAQRRDDPDRQKALKSAVEDASRLLFEIDASTPVAAPPLTPQRAGKAPAPKTSIKPHYHGHRTRLRERFEEAGANALADYELLELLLFRAIPRGDTKPVAKALVARFGDLAAVRGAPTNLIAQVEGAGPAVAQDLKSVQAVLERAQKSEVKRREVI